MTPIPANDEAPVLPRSWWDFSYLVNFLTELRPGLSYVALTLREEDFTIHVMGGRFNHPWDTLT